MFAGEKMYILLEIPNNYNLQISTLQTRLHYSCSFCSTSPVYKILDQYLSKQQLKNCHDAQEIISKSWGDVSARSWEGDHINRPVPHTASISKRDSFNKNVVTKGKR
jgi:hypothetical protein